MRKAILISALGMLLVLYLSPMVMAQCKGHGEKHGAQKCEGHNLNLTEEQKSKIEELRLAHHKKILPLKTDLNNKKTELKLLMAIDNPDMKKIESVIEEMGKIKVQIHKSCIQHKLEVRKLLTPEQQKKFDLKLLEFCGPKSMCGAKMGGKKMHDPFK